MCMHVCIRVYTHTHIYVFHIYTQREGESSVASSASRGLCVFFHECTAWKEQRKKKKTTTAPQNVVLLWLRSEKQTAVANLRHYSRSPWTTPRAHHARCSTSHCLVPVDLFKKGWIVVKKHFCMMEYMKMYKCQILFLFADRLGNALLDGFIFSASPPARFHSISPRRTSFLPHPSPPGGTEGLHCWYSRPHRWAALLWWKSECVESLVELHCMYCIYGIKIVFCSSPVSVPSLLCPPVVKHRCCRQPCKTI